MPATPLPDELVEFLLAPNPAVVATVRPDGSPHTAPTWYEWQDGRVLLNMDRTRVRLGYLRNDPRAALSVIDSEDWYRHVSLIGRVVDLREDDGLRDIDRLSMRYRGEPYRNRESARFSAWLAPDRWHAWGVGSGR